MQQHFPFQLYTEFLLSSSISGEARVQHTLNMESWFYMLHTEQMKQDWEASRERRLRRTRRPLPPVSQESSFLTAFFIAHIKLPVKSAPAQTSSRPCSELLRARKHAGNRHHGNIHSAKRYQNQSDCLLNPFHLPITTTKTQSSFPTAVLASAQK